MKKLPYFGKRYMNKHVFHKILYSFETKFYDKDEIVIEEGDDTDKVYFDTNISLHHHFFSDKEKILLDIKSQDVKISSMPNAPKGKKIKKVELIIHLED